MELRQEKISYSVCWRGFTVSRSSRAPLLRLLLLLLLLPLLLLLLLFFFLLASARRGGSKVRNALTHACHRYSH